MVVSNNFPLSYLSYVKTIRTNRFEVDPGQVEPTIAAGIDVLDGTRGGEADRNNIQSRYLESGLSGGRNVYGHTSISSVLADASSVPDWLQLHPRYSRRHFRRRQGFSQNGLRSVSLVRCHVFFFIPFLFCFYVLSLFFSALVFLHDLFFFVCSPCSPCFVLSVALYLIRLFLLSNHLLPSIFLFSGRRHVFN